HIKKALDAICDRSEVVKNKIREASQIIQDDPAHYPELDEQDERIANAPGACTRVVRIRHDRHDYRLVYLHQKGEERDYVTFYYANDRKDDYEGLDWDLIAKGLF